MNQRIIIAGGAALVAGITFCLALSLFHTTPVAASSLTIVDAMRCEWLDGVWDSATSTCTAGTVSTWGDGLHIPVTTTLVVTDTMVNEPDRAGPGPPLFIIDDVIVDGALIISGTTINDGPVYVNGRLQVHGAWQDRIRIEYTCDDFRGVCVYTSTAGRIVNRGTWENWGEARLPSGLSNHGRLINQGLLEAGAIVDNRGTLTNTGTLTFTNTLRNHGSINSTGMLATQHKLWNWGTLTGTIANDGIIYNLGVLSATIEGDGVVIHLEHHVYLPLLPR